MTPILAGDTRLLEKFRTDDLLPLSSRMRVKLNLDRATPDELEQCLRHCMTKAGAAKLMTPELVTTLCEHAAGNYRTLMTMASDLLVTGAQRGQAARREAFLRYVHADHGRAADNERRSLRDPR
jgi:type II secretory pathway predicted ATPase ExeA